MTRALPAALALLLAGCTVSATQSSKITEVLDRLGNTLTSDLQMQQAVALAATPPDQAGADCADAALQVAAAIQKVAAVTAGKKVGALTMAEIATLYQPGSPQFTWATTTIEKGCLEKAKQINRAVSSTSVISMLPTLLKLGAAI